MNECSALATGHLFSSETRNCLFDYMLERKMKPIMSCADCKHGLYFEDRSVGLFGGYECDNPNIPDGYDDELGNEEEDCKFFEPRIIEKCCNCRRVMNVPQWLWTIYFHGAYGDGPCCCQECLQEAYDKDRKALEYEMKMEEEYRREREW